MNSNLIQLPVQSPEQFLAMSQSALDAIYAQGKADRIPAGVTEGTAMFFPGSFLTRAISKFARIFWQGKVFNEDRTLINRVAGLRLVKAQLYIAESWMDGKPSVIIDYKGSSIVFGWVRDEIREVGPNLWLGRAYGHGFFGRFMAINFAVRFNR